MMKTRFAAAPAGLLLLMGTAGALAATAALVPATAHAQTFSQSRRGDGNLTRDRQGDEHITDASVSLKDDGKVRLVFTGVRDRHTFEGTWTRGSRDQVNLRVEGDFQGRKANASGDLYLTRDGRGFERVTLNGTADGQRFYIRFESNARNDRDWNNDWNDDDWRNPNSRNNRNRRPTNPSDPALREWDRQRTDGGRSDWNDDDRRGSDRLDSTQTGSGRARVAGRSAYDFDRAKVTIRSDTDVRIVFYGDSTQSFGGRVTRRQGENVYVRLEGDIDGDRTVLEGFVNVRRNGRGFDRISLNSRSGRSLSIQFSAR